MSKQLRDRWVQIHQGDLLDIGVPQHLADSEAVAASQDEDRIRAIHAGETGMNEGFVIPVFVARAELEVAVEVKSDVGTIAGENDALVRGGTGVDDGIRKRALFRPTEQGFREDKSGAEEKEQQGTGDAKRAVPTGLIPQEFAGDERDEDIEDTEEKGRTNEAEMGDEDEWEEERSQQSADVIEGENASDEILELEAILQEAEEQGDFEADEGADQNDDSEERDAEEADVGEEGEKEGGTGSSKQADEELDLDEEAGLALFDELREPGTDAHGKQVRADDGGKLSDGIPEKIAGQGAGDEFVDESARCDDEDAGEQQNSR